jgi:D-glycero-beta-D-manno-heptose-7-phosphate kinase
MDNITESRAEEILNNGKGKQIAVIGDVMLDRYFWGSVSRVSPEAPVPVIDLEEETYHLGGAANVAHNLMSLGINPILCGCIGDDEPGSSFAKISELAGISAKGLFVDKGRPTTVKTRIIGNNQQIARLDVEVRDKIRPEAEHFIIKTINETKDLAGIIFEDYNKGTITEFMIYEIISFAKINKIPVFVDPKFDNFFLFKDVTVVKPNKKEAAKALGIQIKTEEDVIRTGKELMERLNCSYVLLTLGKDGMMLFEKDGAISSVPTRARNVADVSGAGDTAIATLSAAIAGGANIRESAALANYASGSVCESPGIVSITIENLLYSIRKNNKMK